MSVITPLWRLLGFGGWRRPSFFVSPPAVVAAREAVAALPDVVKAILILPTLAQQLERVSRNTDALPGMVEQLERIGADTSVLPEMRDEFVVVRSTVVRMQGDTETIAAEMPKLVVLEKSLPGMVPMLEGIDRSVHRLADIAEPLDSAARRLGRFNDRLPQRNGR